MRGFLSLEPDDETLPRLVALQNRLRDSLTRQGVHFPDRLGPTLLAWPYATLRELDLAAELVPRDLPELTLHRLQGRPNDARPAEVGLVVEGCDGYQAALAARLKDALDPDPPKPPFVRLARVSPPSRKVGAALSPLAGGGGGPFGSRALLIWRQSPDGFEIHRTLGRH